MKNKVYTNAIINGHTYSRQPVAAGQKYLDQMTARSGHYINQHEIRGEKIPNIISIEERNEKYLTTNAYGVKIVGNVLGSNYTGIIQFVDKASLQEIPNTNGESFAVIDKNGVHLSGFIDPSDAPITNTAMSDGYTIQLFAEDKTTPIPINYGWTFNCFNGIVHFAPEFKPGSEFWASKGFGNPVLEGFIYIGKTTTNNLTKVSDDIAQTQSNLEDAIANAIAIQPYKFSTDQMDKIGEPYPKELTALPNGAYEYYQRVCFLVPGYCFELTALDRDETVITEMRHLQNGDTQIFMDLPWNLEYDKPIIRWEFEEGSGPAGKYPVIGKYSFIATTFVKNNGGKIAVKETIDCDIEGYERIVAGPYSYITDMETGWRVPQPDSYLTDGPHQSDSSVNVNINVD